MTGDGAANVMVFYLMENKKSALVLWHVEDTKDKRAPVSFRIQDIPRNLPRRHEDPNIAERVADTREGGV
ncbi:hypothetical protein Tco_0530713 [Tanacetum coccineum]